MRPLDSEILIERIAERHGCDPQEVRDLVNFYWGSVKKHMVNFDHPYIYLYGLGSFYIMRYKLMHHIQAYERMMEKYKEEYHPDTGPSNRLQTVEETLRGLYKLLAVMDFHDARKQKARKMRYGIMEQEEE